MEEEYQNIDSRMECMDSDGYKYYTNLYVVKNNLFNANHRYSIKNPFAYDNYQNYIKHNCNNNTTLISSKSVKDGVGLGFKCGLCGNIFIQAWKVFRDFNPHHCCQTCAMKIAAKNETTSIELVNREIENLGLVWFDGVYDGQLSKLHVKDSVGYKGIISLVSLQAGCDFMKFYIGNPYTIENLRLYSALNYIDVKIPDQNYMQKGQKIKFICECNNIFETTLDSFFSGKHKCNICTKSQSNYETKVEEFLNKHNISYIKQYRFNDCRFKNPLPFDFYIDDYGLIEVDGEGHFHPTRFNGMDKIKAIKIYEKTKRYDEIKNNYCVNNNIKLLRLSYVEIDSKEYLEILKDELKSVMV